MSAGLGAVDLVVCGVYLAAVATLTVVVARRQRTGRDYFLAGRAIGGPLLAASIIANQASAVSLVGAPAFVALRPGGGMTWLQYELALPLAMLVAIAIFVPLLRSVPGTSIYAYAGTRFGPGTRRALAGAFVVSRGLALGVILYASALVVAEALGWRLGAALLLVGGAAVAYTSVGGIVADIWTDVLQLGLLWGGTLVAAVYVAGHLEPGALAQVPLARARALDPVGTGLGDGATFALWPMLVGGLFLYVSYYACDQSQAQRLLTARDDAAARHALLWNGLLRFPLVLTYCVFGLLLAALVATQPALAAALDGRPPDALVPVVITTYLPVGVRGLFIAAILAAAMSSIDSALNSLAAVTLDEIARAAPERQSVWVGRLVSLGWGGFAVATGFLFARSGRGVLELVNLVGSAVYGPVLAVFALGALTRGVDGRGAVAGLAAGLAANLAIARLAPGVSWLWWNPIGCAAAAVVAVALCRGPVGWRRPGWPQQDARWLLAAFAVMLVALAMLPVVLRTALGS